MQQFTVPQFIDVEDKIFGPITARQFVIMMIGFVFMAICYKIFDFTLFLTLSITIFFISGIFAFLKVNGMPFHYFVLNFIQTNKRPFLRVWNNAIGRDKAIFEDAVVVEKPVVISNRKFTSSRLTELSLIVDTQGAYRGEGVDNSNNKLEKIKEELDIKI